MAKKSEKDPTLNVRIAPDLRRRVMIAKANTGRTIQDLMEEWIEAGLAKLEGTAEKTSRKGKA